jgi:hypothetical protein
MKLTQILALLFVCFLFLKKIILCKKRRNQFNLSYKWEAEKKLMKLNRRTSQFGELWKKLLEHTHTQTKNFVFFLFHTSLHHNRSIAHTREIIFVYGGCDSLHYSTDCCFHNIYLFQEFLYCVNNSACTQFFEFSHSRLSYEKKLSRDDVKYLL